jgi:hypothetical protein
MFYIDDATQPLIVDVTDPETTERVARAMCREANPCWSIVGEIMAAPDYKEGREGDAGGMTWAGYWRMLARAAIFEINLKETGK